MAFNMLSFLGGLGTGGMAQWQRNKEQERQDKLDEMRIQERGLRMRQLQGQVDDSDRERADRQAVREAGSEVKGSDGVAAGGNFYAAGNEAAANEQAEQDAFIAGDDAAPKAPTKATGLTGGGRPRIGAAGIKIADMNTPDARYERVAQAYENISPEKAMEFRQKAAEFKTRRDELNLKTVYDAGSKMIANGDFEGLAKKWYAGYGDGQDADYVPDGKGGGKFVFKKGDQVVGEYAFKGRDDLQQALRDHVYPDEARARRQVLKDEKEKATAKGQVVPYGAIWERPDGTRLKNDRLPGSGLGTDGKPLTAAFDPYANFPEQKAYEAAWEKLKEDAKLSGTTMTPEEENAWVAKRVHGARQLHAQERTATHKNGLVLRELAANGVDAALRKADELRVPREFLPLLDGRFKTAPAEPVATPGADKKINAPKASEMQGMSDGTLRSLARVPGHTNQKAAQAELERRRAGASTQQVGDTAASSLGFGA